MLNNNLAKYNAELEAADIDETPENELSKEQLQIKIKEMEKRKSKYEDYFKKN